jgi:uncharacterized SAM-binding protein YcdF (DUF218 family)
LFTEGENFLKISQKSLKKLGFSSVIVFGVIIIAWSVLAAMSSVGFSIGMAAPVAVGIVFIAWAMYHLKYDKPVFKPKWLRRVIVTGVCIGIAVILVLETLMMAAAGTVPEDAADTVIVLGCGIFPDGGLTVSLKNRLDAAYEYLTLRPSAKVIVSGGQGDNEPIAEATAMQGYLISLDIDESRIYTEDKSTSTEENLEFSLEIVNQNGLSKNVAIVTSDYHVYRSIQNAEELGFNAIGIPSPTPWRVWLSCHVREWLAILKTTFIHDIEIRLN